MSRNLVRPFFPVAPKDYSSRYFDEIVRSFSVYLQQQQNPGEGRNTFTVFTGLQNDDVGLEPGAVFNAGGFLKVAQTNTPHARGSAALGSVGTVTVVTT
jgi:hypothetical protein